MILAAVLCPHPPLLFRELSGRQDVAAPLREACYEVLREALATEPHRVVVLGGADRPGAWEGVPDVRRFGTLRSRTDEPGLPLSLGVGRRLLDEVGWTGAVELVGLPWDATDDEVSTAVPEGADPAVLLLLGEGSTRRGDKAPGYLDERSFPFDAATSKALETGDAAALQATDVALAEELMVLGRTAFRVLGTVGAPSRTRLAYDDDPFGVAYHVALWTY